MNYVDELKREIKTQQFNRQFASALWSKWIVRMENEISRENRAAFRSAAMWIFVQVGRGAEPEDFEYPCYHRFAEFGKRAVLNFDWKGQTDNRCAFLDFVAHIGLRFDVYAVEEGLR
jgi:hypothetical protein